MLLGLQIAMLIARALCVSFLSNFPLLPPGAFEVVWSNFANEGMQDWSIRLLDGGPRGPNIVQSTYCLECPTEYPAL